ncbi:hypothetical protein C7974DRAFT_422390 [Boeremia exigua]|uniref:uncharacterized protein n=1 Tax=Boeremia exigua TaxID=749465 RepID=UPI001E8E16EE|nr:uncharacterized protein C7974DRAFT_422390 [Boeremia exigua]KAH6639897.1 hypothetical protein C7974DRAFT_422390 [Boeremia exigua]
MYTQLKSFFVVSTTLISLTACALNEKGSNSRNSKCPQFSGNFTISAYQLYPENADFDFNSCVLYTGNLWNASVGIYDPYTTAYESIEFENITGNPDFFIGGVKMNHRTNLLSVTAYANKAFGTEGQDLSGTNYVMQWNPSTRQLHYKHNLTATTQGRFSGLQDVAHDPANNVYVIGTYPSSIVRVDPKGKKAQTWYLEDRLDKVIAGYSGVATKDWTLIANDEATGSLYRFDMRAKKGIPVRIEVTPPHEIGLTDGIQLPPKYNGTVLVVAERTLGASVYRSRKRDWKKAEYLGIVPWFSTDRNVTKALQVGDAVFFNLTPFGDTGIGGPRSAGNRTDFFYMDITGEIDALLRR